MAAGACPGTCCVSFSITSGLGHMCELAAAGDEEAGYIARMLRPQAGTGPFTCQFFDLKSRLCTAYQQRPQMCRAYPYEDECQYCSFESPAGAAINEAYQ